MFTLKSKAWEAVKNLGLAEVGKGTDGNRTSESTLTIGTQVKKMCSIINMLERKLIDIKTSRHKSSRDA